MKQDQDVIISQTTRKEGEEIRCCLGYYKGQPRISVRTWVLKKDGAWIPTRIGVSLYQRELDSVIQGLIDAKRYLEQNPQDGSEDAEHLHANVCTGAQA